MDRQLSINLSIPAIIGPYVVLEQEEWKAYSGKMTKAALVRIFENAYIEDDHDNVYQCVLGRITIFAYPSDPQMDFDVNVSHGSIGFPQIETINKMEQLSIDMVDKIPLQLIPLSLDGIAFSSDCWNEDGQIISPPEVELIGKDLVFSEKIYGQVMVGYSVLRYTFEIDIPERPDSIENAFSSVAYARWDYGVTWLELGWPESRYCGGGGKVIAVPPEKSPYEPPDAGKDRHIKIDYCTQEIISDTNPPAEEE